MKLSIPTLFITFLVLISSCTSYQSLLNYNEPPRIPLEPQLITNFKPLTIQANDVLKIQVSSIDAVAAQPFKVEGGASSDQDASLNNYLVNSEGYIVFPTIGKISLQGLEIEEAKAVILEKIKPYFNAEPIVQVRLTNFRVNVNGEVGSPGTFNVYNNRVSIIEALTLAGDFTPYSRRDSILIIREKEGMRSFGYVNFNSSNVFDSPYFYLQQNDVVYVQPDKTKVNSIRDPATRALPWISAAASLTVIFITLSR